MISAPPTIADLLPRRFRNSTSYPGYGEIISRAVQRGLAARRHFCYGRGRRDDFSTNRKSKNKRTLARYHAGYLHGDVYIVHDRRQIGVDESRTPEFNSGSREPTLIREEIMAGMEESTEVVLAGFKKRSGSVANITALAPRIAGKMECGC